MRLALIQQLMNLRKDWSMSDFKESYADEWEEIPTTVKECQKQMEEYIFHTYDTDYISECIESES